MSQKKVNLGVLLPVLMGFFIMSFCDMVAPVTGGIIKNEFPDNPLVYNLPSLAFVWFLFFSTPISSFVNRKGRKVAAEIGYLLTLVGLIIPFFANKEFQLEAYFIGFAILGLGNTFVQVAINPLLAIIAPEQKMTSYLTLGQIFRNTSLLLVGPMALAMVALFGDWKWLLVVYAALTAIGGIWLQMTDIPESKIEGKVPGWKDCFRLLKNKWVLISALGIGLYVASDVGFNFIGTRLIGDSSILTSTGFYACRIVGTLVGVSVFVYISDIKFMRMCMVLAILSTIVLMTTHIPFLIYAAMGLIGFSVSCVFPTFYAYATKSVPANQANTVAGIMVMSISLGTISSPICGALIESTGMTQMGLIFPLLCVLYIFWSSFVLKAK